jgi:glycopeptide antibiotics resistance protein
MMDRKFWSKLLFGVYCLVMLWLLYGQRMGPGNGGPYWQELRDNLILEPFDTIRRFLWVLRHSSSRGMVTHAVINLAGNVIMFVPLGFFVPVLWEKLRKFGRHFLTMTAVILAVELVQLFTLLGTCDVDDLLLNLVGTTLGFMLWKLGLWIENKK